MLKHARAVLDKIDSVLYSRVVFLGIGLLALAIVYDIANNQLPVMVYKVSNLTIGALAGWIIDVSLFSISKERKHVDSDIETAALFLRRGFVVGMGMMAMAMGL